MAFIKTFRANFKPLVKEIRDIAKEGITLANRDNLRTLLERYDIILAELREDILAANQEDIYIWSRNIENIGLKDEERAAIEMQLKRVSEISSVIDQPRVEIPIQLPLEPVAEHSRPEIPDQIEVPPVVEQVQTEVPAPVAIQLEQSPIAPTAQTANHKKAQVAIPKKAVDVHNFWYES